MHVSDRRSGCLSVGSSWMVFGAPNFSLTLIHRCMNTNETLAFVQTVEGILLLAKAIFSNAKMKTISKITTKGNTKVGSSDKNVSVVG